MIAAKYNNVLALGESSQGLLSYDTKGLNLFDTETSSISTRIAKKIPNWEFFPIKVLRAISSQAETYLLLNSSGTCRLIREGDAAASILTIDSVVDAVCYNNEFLLLIKEEGIITLMLSDGISREVLAYIDNGDVAPVITSKHIDDKVGTMVAVAVGDTLYVYYSGNKVSYSCKLPSRLIPTNSIRIISENTLIIACYLGVFHVLSDGEKIFLGSKYTSEIVDGIDVDHETSTLVWLTPHSVSRVHIDSLQSEVILLSADESFPFTDVATRNGVVHVLNDDGDLFVVK